MNVIVKQISSMEKIRSVEDLNCKNIVYKPVLRGEEFSYQIALYCDEGVTFTVSCESDIENIEIYAVKDVIMDHTDNHVISDDDYITKTPGTMPDLLVPIAETNHIVDINEGCGSIWVRVRVPRDCNEGVHAVKIKLHYARYELDYSIEMKMDLNVMPVTLPEQKTVFTQWFYTDCIASVHNVEIYGEQHWDLIEKYMKCAVDLGINMLLTPVLSPALDTEVGLRRPCVQLVDIEKKNEQYYFDFSRLLRWIKLCKKVGIQYFEISHLFSQWGLKYTPNIKVKENGVEGFMFGWHVSSRDESYKNFLEQFLPALMDIIRQEEIEECCYFHISDEPYAEHVETYSYARDIVKPLIGKCKIMDAISKLEYYSRGLIDIPVTASNHIEAFLEHGGENQWAYHCVSQSAKVGNRFMAMPSYRNRILGLQIYKFGIKGFLQWGYNFYYSQYSRFCINPYLTTSAGKAFPAGDPFSVYPSKDGVYPSLRAIIFKEALQDVEICRLLEEKIGKEKVVEMIDSRAGMDLRFSEYPRNSSFIPMLVDDMKKALLGS